MISIVQKMYWIYHVIFMIRSKQKSYYKSASSNKCKQKTYLSLKLYNIFNDQGIFWKTVRNCTRYFSRVTSMNVMDQRDTCTCVSLFFSSGFIIEKRKSNIYCPLKLFWTSWLMLSYMSSLYFLQLYVYSFLLSTMIHWNLWKSEY